MGDNLAKGSFGGILVLLVIVAILIMAGAIAWLLFLKKRRTEKSYERGLKMVPMLIHLPPATDDIQGNGRDERDITNEAISQAQIMYSILASTLKKGWKSQIYGQRHMSFELVSTNGLIKYYAVIPGVLTETVKQAVVSAYPAARLEEVDEENIFSSEGEIEGVAGGELSMKKDAIYPIATFEEMKWDGSTAILNALSNVKMGEGMALQLLFRPLDQGWIKKSTSRTQEIQEGKGGKKTAGGIAMYTLGDIIRAPFEPPEAKEKEGKEIKPLTGLQQAEIQSIENKTHYPGFEVLIRVIASSASKPRSDALLGGLVSAFAQFDSTNNNGFKFDGQKDMEKLAQDYIFRNFPVKKHDIILNSIELATLFHLPNQNVIPNSQVERQLTKQVDGPARIPTDGVWLGVNKFRGVEKKIYLSENDRRRHTYVIGATGMGKSVLLKNIAYQDMLAGRGFAFIDPHGDVAEELLSMVPPDRVDDVIYFDPGDIEHPMGMNMFEFSTPDQKDFIVQEGINMLQSLYDPGNQGFFGPRGQHMFRNAALLLMSDPEGATFIDIPRCFTDPEFVKHKLQFVTDRAVYDYWTKEFPASQKSNDAGEVITWFASKWGPFIANTMMKNTLGQIKSGFNIRELMDKKKILLVNLSKGKMGEVNSRLLGMIFVMKFQTAAMSRVDTPENERNDFCLFVDEFQNFATESFESILSEARKFRLNLVVANQFMTQLTDKIREGILGNVGTIICGRIGITDAQMMEKAFMPTFNAEDLHNQPNHHAITQVMMFDMPSKPFTMALNPPLASGNPELMQNMKLYSATKYGRVRAEVEKEINERMSGAEEKAKKEKPITEFDSGGEKGSFLDKWKKDSQVTSQEDLPEMELGSDGLPLVPNTQPKLENVPGAGVNTAIKNDGAVFDNTVPDEEVANALNKPAEALSLPDNGTLQSGQVIQLR